MLVFNTDRAQSGSNPKAVSNKHDLCRSAVSRRKNTKSDFRDFNCLEENGDGINWRLSEEDTWFSVIQRKGKKKQQENVYEM